MKSAVSLDGKTATVTGDSQWITGEEARLDVHHYRNKNDAILVGVNTVINDNPRLTTRLPEGGKNPIRIIVDNSLRTPAHSHLINDGESATWIGYFPPSGNRRKNPIRIIVDNSLRTPAHSHLINDGESATWIFVGDQVQQAEIDQFPKDPSVEIIQLPGKIKIEHVLAELGRREIMSLYVEGGAEVNGSFLESKLLNQLITYVAPKLIGGRTAPTSFSGTGDRKSVV